MSLKTELLTVTLMSDLVQIAIHLWGAPLGHCLEDTKDTKQHYLGFETILLVLLRGELILMAWPSHHSLTLRMSGYSSVI